MATGAPLRAGNGEGGGARSVRCEEQGGRVSSPGPLVASSRSCPEAWPGSFLERPPPHAEVYRQVVKAFPEDLCLTSGNSLTQLVV